MRYGLFDIDQNGNIIAKDGDGNSVQITDNGGLNTGNGSLGGYQKDLNFSGAISTNYTSATYVDINGTSNVSFVTPVSGPHIFIFESRCNANVSQASAQFALLLDDTTDYPFPQQMVKETFDGAGYTSLTQIITLSAGAHTIRPRVRRVSGAGDVRVTSGNLPIHIMAQGSGINGLEVQTHDLSSSFAVTQAYIDQPGGNMAQVDSSEATINTLEGERVQVSFNGNLQASAGTSDIILGYQIDSDTPIPVHYANETSTSINPITFSTMTEPLSAGQHIIKLMASKTVGAPVVYVGNITGAHFVVTRFKSFGIGAGTIVTKSATAIQNTSITSTSYISIGSAVTINTIANETVQLAASISADITAGTFATDFISLAYSLDGAAEVLIWESRCPANGIFRPSAFIVSVAIPTSGSHTIQLRTKVSAGTFRIFDSGIPSSFAVTQYRGGLIPIKDDGVEIVDKPSALNFVGAQITNVNGEAKVTFPNAALGGYQKKFDFVGSTTTTSATFVDVTGMPNQTFTTPVSGQHLIFFSSQTYVTGTAATVVEMGLSIDNAAAVVVGKYFHPTISVYEAFTGFALVTLAAGSHTIKPQWRRVSGSGTVTVDGGGPWSAIVQAQGTGINGLEVIEDAYSNTTVTAVNPTYETIASVTVNCLEGERINISNAGRVLFVTTTGTVLYLAYRVDGGSDVAIMSQTGQGGGANATENISFNIWTDALSAGQHTIDFRASKIGSDTTTLTGTGGQSDSTFRAVRYKSIGIGAGTIVNTSGFLGAAKSITSSHPTYEDTGLIVSFTTVANEEVLLTFVGSAVKDGAGGGGFYVAYQLDAGSDIPTFIQSEGAAGNRGNISFSVPVTVATAGLHTIKIRAARDGGGTWTMPVTATAPAGSSQQIAHVVQYRGGLIPIQDDGVEIVDKPSALDFAGGGVVVTQSGSKALITIPGGGVPSAHASTHIKDGTDEIDGDQLDIDWNPTNYTPTVAPTEVTDVDHLTAHLAGIDAELGAPNDGNPLTRTATGINYQTTGESIVGCTAAAITITLATADVVDGQFIYIKDESGAADAGANKIIIATQGAETIDGVATIEITVAYGVAKVYSDGINWFTL